MDSESENANQTSKTWAGSSIEDICKGKSRWSFSITPVTASRYHNVLYELPVTLKEPPKPYTPSQLHLWDDDYVKMPFSDKNLFPVAENGCDVIKKRWKLICKALSKPISNSREFELIVMSYNGSVPKFSALHYFFEEVSGEMERQMFFKNLLPNIIRLALQLPYLLPGGIPLLKQNYNRSVSLSQHQIASLLANAFLCTFPWKKDSNTYPGVNFIKLFAAHSRPRRQSCIAEKFKCIFNYFRRVCQKTPCGVLTFERKFVHRSDMPRWDNSVNILGNTKIHINSSGTIEDDGFGFLQVDFANKNVGGGVLGYGCVQEEIRFIICPELIISRLFVEQLGDHEAVVVTGPERYSKYSGYGDTFSWEGDFFDTAPHDEYGRKRTTVCIIDATHFNKSTDQFYPSAMLRELNKAYVGFSSHIKENLAPVATGNWGCGAFRGSSHLKALLQLMACNAARRDLVYYSFGNEDLRNDFSNIYTFLASNNVTMTQLWRYLCSFATAKVAQENLYSFIQQAYFDSKKYPTIREFYMMSLQKKEQASTSSKEEEKSPELFMEDSDIFEMAIPTTPPPFNKFKKKKKPTDEDSARKLPKMDVEELFDLMDGFASGPEKQTCDDATALTEVDTSSKKIKVQLENKKIEDDSTTRESQIPQRKISDYFRTVPKPS